MLSIFSKPHRKPQAKQKRFAESCPRVTLEGRRVDLEQSHKSFVNQHGSIQLHQLLKH
jgi:hypothetical protein